MKEIILSKESSEKEIKDYFNVVLKLTQSKNEFPVNLDEVWPLVYSEKGKAVRALKENFIKDVDFKTLAQNGKQDGGVLPKNGEQDSTNSWGGNNKIEYYLTVPCMEFFIARKVRPVFEIYRKVFHHAVNNAVPKISEKIQAATWAAKFLNLNESSKLMLAKQILDPLGLPTPDYTPSKGILKSATELLRDRGMDISAQTFNQRAVERGFLCNMARKSSSGAEKSFKSITEKGREYGENQVNPNNPKSTQPLWYEHKFDEFIIKLGLS